MRISSGALHTDNAFFIRNKRGDDVISANDPKANVRVARERPMMVKY